MRAVAYLRRDRDLAARWLACPFLIFFLLTSTGIGALFWVQAALQDQAFSAQTFGRFALQFPAEFWAGAMMAGSLVTFGGLMHPPRRWAMLLGAAINATQFAGLAYSAIFTGGEVVVGLYAGLMFTPASVITLWAAAQHEPD